MNFMAINKANCKKINPDSCIIFTELVITYFDKKFCFIFSAHKKKRALISSDEDEDDDEDEEKAREEMKGFIAVSISQNLYSN